MTEQERIRRAAVIAGWHAWAGSVRTRRRVALMEEAGLIDFTGRWPDRRRGRAAVGGAPGREKRPASRTVRGAIRVRTMVAAAEWRAGLRRLRTGPLALSLLCLRRRAASGVREVV